MQVRRSSLTPSGVHLRALLCVFLAIALNLYTALDGKLPGQPTAAQQTLSAVLHSPAVQAHRLDLRFANTKHRVQTHAAWLVPAIVCQLRGRSVAANEPANVVVHAIDPATLQRGRAPPIVRS